MAICRHPAWAARCCAALLAALSPALSAAPPAAHASTPAAWEELRLRAIQTCTAELLSRNVNVLAVEPIDSSGATATPTSDGLRVRLKVQRPGQAARTLLCSYRWPQFNPAP
ncbi:MAG: hypothetical protein VKK43_08145 [Synechococcaceae cyanobacterium]|jgi:hypothetical protein|nr:hypothetical protein [Synechococcaceae cyanobacterium]